MELRRLPATKIVAGALVVLLLGFDLVTYLYELENQGNMVNLAVFDGVVSAGVVVLAFALLRTATPGRASKLTFVAAAVFFLLWVFVIVFSTPYTEIIAVSLAFAALITVISGIFMRRGR